MKEKFRKVSPKDYAEKLKEEYNRNSEKWYESVDFSSGKLLNVSIIDL